MDLGFAGATVVVTGGSKGMGLAIAETLGVEGAAVAIMARGRDGLDAAAERIGKAGAPEVLTVSVDMADPESIAAGYSSVRQRWGTLNALVHTVGPGAGSFEDLDDDDWYGAFDLGTLSAVRSVRAALPMLRAADWARIVTLSAHSIQRQSPRLVAYTATKAALSSSPRTCPRALVRRASSSTAYARAPSSPPASPRSSRTSWPPMSWIPPTPTT
jgi:NAD(P)-dependent dehydrogenase (short-subunit alcohol dehydrogenase family)